MGNLPFQRKSSDFENNREVIPAEVSTFDFENNQHPLLIHTVLREIFKYSSIAELKNFRQVCKDWNFEAFDLLKKIGWKSPTLIQTIGQLNSFVKTFGPCPQNILNQNLNLDCGQILVPSDKAPEIFFHKILPIMSCIKGLKVNTNIQKERTFVAHEAFQHLAQTLKTFDVRFIKNDNISLTPDTVYPPTQLPSLPALTSVKIRMGSFVKCGNRIVHPDYLNREPGRKYGGKSRFILLNSEHKMLIELIQELVTKSPLLSEIHVLMSNPLICTHNLSEKDSFEHITSPIPISILTNLKRNELEKITHLRFPLDDKRENAVGHLLTLAKSGLNRLKYIRIDHVFIGGGMEDYHVEKFREILEFQKDTLEYFKVKNFGGGGGDSSADTIELPPLLPKLKVLKLARYFGRYPDSFDLNRRFPHLTEIDITGESGFLSGWSWIRVDDGPLIPLLQVKKLHVDNQSFLELSQLTQRTLSEYFPNVTQVKYHMEDKKKGSDEMGRVALWRMTSLEHIVLKVPLYSSYKMEKAILKPFEFISGGMTKDKIDRLQSPQILLAQLRSLPNITWLTELKSLKIKQRRRYEDPEGDERGYCGWIRFRKHQQLASNILSNMTNLEHFSSDLHCFSEESITQLKLKIQEFEPGRRIE